MRGLIALLTTVCGSAASGQFFYAGLGAHVSVQKPESIQVVEAIDSKTAYGAVEAAPFLGYRLSQHFAVGLSARLPLNNSKRLTSLGDDGFEYGNPYRVVGEYENGEELSNWSWADQLSGREPDAYGHLPVQSGSDAMLEVMKRGYTRAEFLALVDKLRAAIPGLALSTDIMVGFWGETEEHHADTLSLMDAVRFDCAFMFKYSDRGTTYAARKLQDDVTDAVKARRLQEVIELQEQHTRASHAARVGARAPVLIRGTSHRGDRLVGRTPSFHNVLLPLGTGLPGQIIDVAITGTTGHSLIAG